MDTVESSGTAVYTWYTVVKYYSTAPDTFTRRMFCVRYLSFCHPVVAPNPHRCLCILPRRGSCRLVNERFSLRKHCTKYKGRQAVL